MSDDKDEIVQQEINKAINYLGQNKFSEAEQVCNKIITESDNADAFHVLASIKIYKQEFAQSVELVKKSLKINSSNPGYHVTLGCAYSAAKEYRESIKPFKDAIKLNDKIAQVHFYLGESYRKLKKYNDAISSFYKTLELSPDHIASYMLLGIVYQEKKQFDLAIKSFKTCIDIMPEYAEAHINLGLCYLLVGDYENGWGEYEWRRKLFKQNTDQLSKEWTGQNLEGKTLLILDESSNDNLILPLMGRRLMSGRDKWQYYSMSNTGHLNSKLPININGKSCTGEYGCDPIYNGDMVYVEGYNDTFKATIYDNNRLEYIPYI